MPAPEPVPGAPRLGRQSRLLKVSMGLTPADEREQSPLRAARPLPPPCPRWAGDSTSAPGVLPRRPALPGLGFQAVRCYEQQSPNPLCPPVPVASPGLGRVGAAQGRRYRSPPSTAHPLPQHSRAELSSGHARHGLRHPTRHPSASTGLRHREQLFQPCGVAQPGAGWAEPGEGLPAPPRVNVCTGCPAPAPRARVPSVSLRDRGDRARQGPPAPPQPTHSPLPSPPGRDPRPQPHSPPWLPQHGSGLSRPPSPPLGTGCSPEPANTNTFAWADPLALTSQGGRRRWALSPGRAATLECAGTGAGLRRRCWAGRGARDGLGHTGLGWGTEPMERLVPRGAGPWHGTTSTRMALVALAQHRQHWRAALHAPVFTVAAQGGTSVCEPQAGSVPQRYGWSPPSPSRATAAGGSVWHWHSLELLCQRSPALSPCAGQPSSGRVLELGPEMLADEASSAGPHLPPQGWHSPGTAVPHQCHRFC